MNTISYQLVHSKFKLNGFHLNRKDLCRVAYSFIKEGEDFEKPVGDFLLDWFDKKEYLEMQTSGSTGAPKTIRVQKQAMVNSAIATGDYFGIEPGNKALHCLPVKYVAGKMMLIRAMILGLDLDFVAPNLNPMAKTDTIYDFAAMVPMQAKNSLDKLKNVKKLIVGGAKVSAKLEKELIKKGNSVFETFGMTETISHIAAKEVGSKSFSTLPGIEISYDENKCLLVKASRISDEIIKTNDLVEIINDNEFIFLGRIDNVINSGGIKIIPEVVELKLSNFITQNFYISSKEDAELGQKVVLIIEGKSFEIEQSVFETLDKYEKPKEIIFVDKFKETPTGKILRK